MPKAFSTTTVVHISGCSVEKLGLGYSKYRNVYIFIFDIIVKLVYLMFDYLPRLFT